MGVKNGAEYRESERMSDFAFRMMVFLFNLIDFFYPHLDRRVKKFGLQDGMVVADYGCGPGRYTIRFARQVGESGQVYAVDIHPLAMEALREKIEKNGLKNVIPILAKDYDSGLPDALADRVCAIDMFFGIKDPTTFLGELKRITKPDGLLIIDDGHQPRLETRRKILDSGFWEIIEESKDHLKCEPTTG